MKLADLLKVINPAELVLIHDTQLPNEIQTINYLSRNPKWRNLAEKKVVNISTTGGEDFAIEISLQ